MPLSPVVDLLRRAAAGPAGLIVQGEPGIGKTTMWLDAVDRARADGMVVLAARGASAELTLTYSALADLLTGLDDEVLAALPETQRQTLGRVLPGAAYGPPTDERAVAAAFLAVLEELAREHRVLVAIDDAQWLDPASRTAIGYALRRLTSSVAVLVTVRATEPVPDPLSWLTLPRPELLVRHAVSGLSLGGLHQMFSRRLGRTFPRPTITHIHRMSGGNPFYALELAHAVIRDGAGRELPDSLAALVAERVGRLDEPTTEALLLLAACVRPALDRIARAAQCSPDELVLLLEPAEDQGLITMAGNAIGFTHPLLASGVYTNATNAQRRAAHRRLAEVVDSPELRARHLALASAGADPETLAALDAAVAVTAAQGAPATAAELLELAIARGGDTPLRRILCATHHFTAGDAQSAQKLLAGVIDELPSGPVRATALLMLGGISVYTDGFTAAAGWLRQGVETTTDPAMLAQLHMMLSFTAMNLGEFADAECTLDVAAARAEDLGSDAVRSQVLSLQTMLGCLRGGGICPDRRRLALELEDRDLVAPIIFRATANEMQLRFWEGDLTGGLELYEQLWRSAAERGAESELLFLAVQGTLGSSWKGDLVRATAIARDATERADQLGGDNSKLIAAVARAGPAALTGRIDDARQACAEATEIAVHRGADRVQYAAASSLGLLEVSLGRYPEAIDALSGVIANFRREPWITEIHSAVFVSEAVEALVALDRLDEAESLVAAMETGGARLGRPWTIAEGARGRAMLLVARGDLAGAEAAVRRALAEHDHLEMAFTRARIVLLLGQILRRRRRRQAAAEALAQALWAFEDMGAQIWAQRARDELARVAGSAPVGTGLTSGELRVAERAAAGMSNKEIAVELFIAPKTVEMNLTSAYRKLGIRSRSQLHARLSEDTEVRSQGNP